MLPLTEFTIDTRGYYRLARDAMARARKYRRSGEKRDAPYWYAIAQRDRIAGQYRNDRHWRRNYTVFYWEDLF